MNVRRGLKDATKWARSREPRLEGEALAEAIEERAAILEFDAGMSREGAERKARELHGGVDGVR